MTIATNLAGVFNAEAAQPVPAHHLQPALQAAATPVGQNTDPTKKLNEDLTKKRENPNQAELTEEDLCKCKLEF